MGHFQIPVSWYRDETMLHLMDKNPASIGVYVMMISWCSDNKSHGDIPYVDFRYVLDGEDEELQALIDAGLITKTEKFVSTVPSTTSRASGASTHGRGIRSAISYARWYTNVNCRCVACGATDHLSLDHIIPWSLGGEDTMENLQTMCRSCNSRKGNRVDVVQGG